MKLSIHTSTGLKLGLDVRLTGRLRADPRDRISGVEVYMPAGCTVISDDFVDAGPCGQQVLWVDPKDLCRDDGNVITQIEIHAAVTTAKDKLHAEMLRGPLGKDWL